MLVAGVAGAGALALAACSSGGSAKTADPSSAANPPSTPSTPSVAASGAAGDSTAASSPAAGGTTLTALADIRVGQAVSVNLPDSKPGVVARPTSSTAVCFSAICTHMGCTVKPAGAKLDCPCHGSQYSATTGKVLAGPAPSPLPSIAVQVVDGNVVLKS